MIQHHFSVAVVNFSSCQRNLIKTFQIEAYTSGITKIALKKILDFFDKDDRLAKLQNSDFQSHFSTSTIVQIFTKKKIIEEYQSRTTTFVKIIF